MTTTKKKIEIYTTTHCPYCVKAKALFQKKGVEYIEINVDDDTERQKMIQLTGGARSVPQIFADGEFLPGGCDGLFERERKGELNEILGLS
ncbi:MAG: glutaredoxin [Candidatus Melainabacteria bacterium]|jgi:glutaredoxin 3